MHVQLIPGVKSAVLDMHTAQSVDSSYVVFSYSPISISVFCSYVTSAYKILCVVSVYSVLGDNACNKDIIFMDKRTPATIVL